MIVNGRRSWKAATTAIWFERRRWKIGYLEMTGTSACGIYSDSDSGLDSDFPFSSYLK